MRILLFNIHATNQVIKIYIFKEGLISTCLGGKKFTFLDRRLTVETNQ